MDSAQPQISQVTTETRRLWWSAGAMVLAYWLLVLVLFRDTAWSIESIWASSTTFAHGYLVVPIAFWLVYRLRDQLAMLRPRGCLWAALLLFPTGLLWLAASLADVRVVEQLALITMLILGTWMILGTRVCRRILFPLLFLYFAVPMGNELILPLQEFTATATVRMVELSGIPVYREGMQFSLPTGNWHVVEACSGVRYLIASVTLGFLFAYLNYNSWWRRTLLIVLAFLFPVVANALRAYALVMLGHFTEGRLGTGVDHMIYGWVIFGLVIFGMFWLGSLWAEPELIPPRVSDQSPSIRRSLYGVLTGGCLAAVLVLAIGPLQSRAVNAMAAVDTRAQIVLPVTLGEWRRTNDMPRWRPQSLGAVTTSGALYVRKGQVYLEVQRFPALQEDGAEAVTGYRSLIAVDDRPDMVNYGTRKLNSPEGQLEVTEFRLRQGEQRLRIWYWYRIGERSVGNPYLAKLLEVMLSISGKAVPTDRIVLVAADPEGGSATSAMEDFILAHWSGLTGKRNSD